MLNSLTILSTLPDQFTILLLMVADTNDSLVYFTLGASLVCPHFDL